MTYRQAPLRLLSPTRCWELLEHQEVGRIATSVAGHTDIFTVNYRVLNKTIVIRTEESLLLESAIASEAIAFEVDALDRVAHTGWSVVIRGTAQEPQHMEDYLSAQNLALSPWPASAKDRYVIITPVSISGRVLPPATSAVLLRGSNPSN